MIKLINIYILTIKIEKCMINITSNKRKPSIYPTETYTRAPPTAKLNTAMEFIATLTEMCMKEIGKMMCNRVMVFCNLPMDLSMRANLLKDYLQAKVSIIINLFNTTI